MKATRENGALPSTFYDDGIEHNGMCAYIARFHTKKWNMGIRSKM